MKDLITNNKYLTKEKMEPFEQVKEAFDNLGKKINEAFENEKKKRREEIELIFQEVSKFKSSVIEEMTKVKEDIKFLEDRLNKQLKSIDKQKDGSDENNKEEIPS